MKIGDRSVPVSNPLAWFTRVRHETRTVPTVARREVSQATVAQVRRVRRGTGRATTDAPGQVPSLVITGRGDTERTRASGNSRR